MVSESNEAGYGTMQEPVDSNASPTTSKSIAQSFPKRMKQQMGSDIDLQRTHFILIILFFVTGLVDSAAYNIWSCFVSMQTGRYYSEISSTYTQRKAMLSSCEL
jgi:Protein of unknown function (DUF1275)